MAYIGRPLNAGNLAVQSGTGDGSDTTPIATLNYATTTNGIAVYLDGVRQLAGTDYNVTAQTTLTFTTAPANGVGVDVYFLGLEVSIPTPADGTISTAKIANNAVDETKLKDALIGDFTDATVTGSDTFLYGDATDSGNTKRDTVQGILDLAGGGRMTLLSTASPSGASSADMTTGISDTYDSYFLEVVNLVCATDDVQLYVRLSSDGGSSFLTTTSYEWRFLYNYDGTARGSYDTNNNHWTVFLHSDNGASTSSGSLGITLQGIRQTTLYPTFHGTGVTHNASGVLQSQFLAGEFKVAGTKYNGIQVLAASGNITGTVRLYGIS